MAAMSRWLASDCRAAVFLCGIPAIGQWSGEPGRPRRAPVRFHSGMPARRPARGSGDPTVVDFHDAVLLAEFGNRILVTQGFLWRILGQWANC